MRRWFAGLAVVGGAMASVVITAPAALAQVEVVSNATIESVTLQRDRSVLVELSAECTNEGETVFLDANVTQPVGRTRSVFGFGFTEVTCEGGTATGTIVVFPEQGRFGPGTAFVRAAAVVCEGDEFEPCSVAEVQESVRLTTAMRSA